VGLWFWFNITSEKTLCLAPVKKCTIQQLIIITDTVLCQTKTHTQRLTYAELCNILSYLKASSLFILIKSQDGKVSKVTK
jgi:hypothetical protein